MIYFLSEQRIKTDFLNDNMDSDLILNAIRESQDIYLRTIIGDSLYNTLSRLIENDIVVEPYKNLLDNFIIIYLEYKTLSSLCVTSTFKLSNMGMAQAYDSNINTQSMQNVKYLQSHYDSKASFYESRLTEYLTQNINVFPDYKNYKDITTSRSTTSQSGLFLGGARTITTINDIDMKHDNTVRSYVRYDIYQNLSEQQKEIARENIGVTANGEINVDLENYYTKDEVYNKNQVDTKLIPYITTNEVNLRLNSYYDKSQTDTAIQNAIDNIDVDLSNYYDKNTVNNLLDNLPIPEYTSELIKDDVYTKNEVDERIANVSSGGSVDLSNYYTKQETYSKDEVNELVANSGGGGSDTPSNTTIVDIMSLPYDKQLEIIDFVIDNNRFPDLNTLYTYQGYILNNLEHYSDWWDEALNQRYVVFSLYAHPKSYDIRFITYQWNEGKIYNDINEKDFNDWLVTNGEINNKLNTLSNGLVLDLFQYDNDELAHVYNKIYYMGEQFTDKPITYRGKFINNITIEGEKVRFWHYAITTDSNNINSDKSFYVDVEMYDDIMGLVRTIYTEIGDCTVIGGNGGGTTDLSNYYNKQETDTAIQNAVDGIETFSGNYNDLTNKPTLFSGSYNDLSDKPTLSNVATSGNYLDLNNLPTLFDGDYNSLENKPTLFSGSYTDLTNTPTIPTATSQLTLDTVYSKSEIDLQFAEINTTLGDINNLLETI